MATNAEIFIQQEKGKNIFIPNHVHFDGYPEHTFKVLKEHYTDREKANMLLQAPIIYINENVAEYENSDFDSLNKEYRDRKAEAKETKFVPLSNIDFFTKEGYLKPKAIKRKHIGGDLYNTYFGIIVDDNTISWYHGFPL